MLSKAFRKRALNQDKPEIRGFAENPDVYFQHTEASNRFYDAMRISLLTSATKISEITGRTYKPFALLRQNAGDKFIMFPPFLPTALNLSRLLVL